MSRLHNIDLLLFGVEPDDKSPNAQAIGMTEPHGIFVSWGLVGLLAAVVDGRITADEGYSVVSFSAGIYSGRHTVLISLSAMVWRLASHNGNRKPM